MNAHDPILAADLHEEQEAAKALHAAKTKDELVSVWWQSCEHFEGQARNRLQDEYATALLQFAPMGLAG